MAPGQIQLRPVKMEIVLADSITNLERVVTGRLENGWMLHGDWTIINELNKPPQFAQAMVQMAFKTLELPKEIVEQQMAAMAQAQVAQGRGSILLPAGGPSPLIR